MAIRIEKSEQAGRFLVKVWYGKQSKPTYFYSYKTQEKRDVFASECEANDAANDEAKIARKSDSKARTEAMQKRVQVGTIFHNGWGYDQTQCDFYEVVEKSASGATVKLRKILGSSVPGSEGMMSERMVPCPGSFVEGSEIFEKRVGPYGISFKSGGSQIVEPGQTFYCSWYA